MTGPHRRDRATATGRRRTHALPVLAALALAVGLIAAPPRVSEVRAASPDLTIVGAARYDVQPANHRVRVTIDLTLANHLVDTKTTRYFFDQAFLAVIPHTSAYAVSWTGAGTPSVAVSSRSADATILRIRLGARLYSGQTATYRLRFDIVDTGGKATRDIRVGDSLVSFPVWAFASDATPGSTVMVVFPKGYQAQVAGGAIPAPSTDTAGRTIFRSGTLAKPLSFFAFLVADRPGAYRARSIAPIVEGSPAPLTIRSWPDDAAWDTRVGTLVAKGLPVLGTAIGLRWPRTSPLTIQEAVSRSASGYAGLFDPTNDLVQIAYYADSLVVLHESAHAWFDGALLADRWENEAFASYYAQQAAATLKIKVTGPVLTDALKKSRIPLNAWEAIGRASSAAESYGYAASLALANAIAERAGADTLRRVWGDAAARVGAYQPPTGTSTTAATGPPETVAGAPDWRGLLDLLEAETGQSFDDLWRTWVARPEDLALLDARAAARTRYAAVLAVTDGWQLPKPIRDALRAWRFEDAGALLDQATQVLDERTAVARAAAAAGLTPPTSLRVAFEGDAGFAAALDEGTAELAAIARYQAAAAARPSGDGLVTTMGLWGDTPGASLVAARTAFARGELAASAAASDEAASIWASASPLGRSRVTSLLILAVAGFFACALVILWSVGRRQRRWIVRQAHRLTR